MKKSEEKNEGLNTEELQKRKEAMYIERMKMEENMNEAVQKINDVCKEHNVRLTVDPNSPYGNPKVIVLPNKQNPQL